MIAMGDPASCIANQIMCNLLCYDLSEIFRFKEMKHFEALREKLDQMERRHGQREQELQKIIQQSRASAALELDEESSKWRALVDAKNREVEKFRSELDSILSVLRELQRQGVILPGQKNGPRR